MRCSSPARRTSAPRPHISTRSVRTMSWSEHRVRNTRWEPGTTCGTDKEEANRRRRAARAFGEDGAGIAPRTVCAGTAGAAGRAAEASGEPGVEAPLVAARAAPSAGASGVAGLAPACVSKKSMRVPNRHVESSGAPAGRPNRAGAIQWRRHSRTPECVASVSVRPFQWPDCSQLWLGDRALATAPRTAARAAAGDRRRVGGDAPAPALAVLALTRRAAACTAPALAPSVASDAASSS
mmetsp:Transcript_14796/g.55765  ORF Transcript_14796/g.55765 Transcript_14796/m.55765 type:complete len:238 (+) Transcript_14796:166-879(+)